MNEAKIDEFIKKLVASDTTKQSYRRFLNSFLKWGVDQYGEMDLERVTRSEVQNFIYYLENVKKMSVQTVDVHFFAISKFCKSMGRYEAISDIRKNSEVKEAPEGHSEKEERKLIRDVEKTGNLRNIAIVNILLYSGLRVSELCNLNLENIEMGERSGLIHVIGGKGKKSRKVPFPVEARRALQKYLEIRKDVKHSALFLTIRTGQRMHPRDIQHLLEKFGTHPHKLRHTYARRLVGRGVDIVAVADLMGHSDINITRQYAKSSLSELTELVERAFSQDSH